MDRKIRQLIPTCALVAGIVLFAASSANAAVVNLVCAFSNSSTPANYWIDLDKKTITLDARGAPGGGGSVMTGPVEITATTYTWLNFSSWQVRLDRTTGNATVSDSNNQYKGWSGKCSKGSAPMPAAKL